jgi:hypothetical protein
VIFRDFVEETKDAVRELAGGTRGDRDITPMVHLETEETGRELVAVDPLFFTEESGVENLVEGFLIPLIQERMAIKVAWTFTSATTTDNLRMAVAVVIDRERHETWLAPLFPEGIGEWLGIGPNSTYGLLVGPIQEALR